MDERDNKDRAPRDPWFVLLDGGLMQTLPPPGKAGLGPPTQLRFASDQSRFDLRSMRLWSDLARSLAHRSPWFCT